VDCKVEEDSNDTAKQVLCFQQYSHDYSPPSREAEYCDERVCVCVCFCVCVCLSVRDHLGNYPSDLHNVLCMLPMAVARSYFGGVVMCYVLPVLWMTSYLLMGQGCSASPPS